MSATSLIELLEAGVHFGHQTQHWNPKMKPYIYGARNGIYILDLRKTTDLLDAAYDAVRDQAAKGRNVLFVGTKKQAAEVIAEEATRAGAYYINRRWLGGMLTNFETIRGRVNKLRELEEEAGKDIRNSIYKIEPGFLITDGIKFGMAAICYSDLEKHEMENAFTKFQIESNNHEIDSLSFWNKENLDELAQYEEKQDLGVAQLIRYFFDSSNK